MANPIQNQIPPEEKYRQPGAYEHGVKKYFQLHHMVGYALLGMIFLAIVAVAYWYEVSHSQPTPAPVTHTDPTADWKTYTNKKYGYTISYPSNWYISSGPEDVHISTINPDQEENRSNPVPVDTIEIQAGNAKPADISLLDYIKSTNGPVGSLGYLVNPRSTTLNGYTAVISDSSGGEPGVGMNYAVQKDNTSYTDILIYLEAKKPETNQILSTFKFTDSATATVSGHLTLVSCSPETLNKTCFPPTDPFTKVPVTIRAIQNGKIVKSVVADANGDYSLQLDPGTYGIDRDWPGYNAAHSPIAVTLTAGETKQVNFSAGVGQ